MEGIFKEVQASCEKNKLEEWEFSPEESLAHAKQMEVLKKICQNNPTKENAQAVFSYGEDLQEDYSGLIRASILAGIFGNSIEVARQHLLKEKPSVEKPPFVEETLFVEESPFVPPFVEEDTPNAIPAPSEGFDDDEPMKTNAKLWIVSGWVCVHFVEKRMTMIMDVSGHPKVLVKYKLPGTKRNAYELLSKTDFKGSFEEFSDAGSKCYTRLKNDRGTLGDIPWSQAEMGPVAPVYRNPEKEYERGPIFMFAVRRQGEKNYDWFTKSDIVWRWGREPIALGYTSLRNAGQID